MAQALALVMLGAAFGGAARFLITHYSSELSNHQGFAFGTLAVNVIGSFLVGYVLTWSADHAHDRWRLLAATGFCGAFTTFSAFAYETMQYWREGALGLVALNVVLNNALSCAAVMLGVAAHVKIKN